MGNHPEIPKVEHTSYQIRFPIMFMRDIEVVVESLGSHVRIPVVKDILWTLKLRDRAMLLG